MINNLRIEVENDSGWIFSEGTDIDFALDGTSVVPTDSVSFPNPTGGMMTNYQKNNGPGFQAFQGLEPGSVGGFPLTNDPNEFGSNTYGTATFNITAVAVLAGAGTQATLTFPIGNWTGNSATAPTAGSFVFALSDGRQAFVPLV